MNEIFDTVGSVKKQKVFYVVIVVDAQWNKFDKNPSKYFIEHFHNSHQKRYRVYI